MIKFRLNFLILQTMTERVQKKKYIIMYRINT